MDTPATPTTPAAPLAAAPATSTITYEDFMKIQLRIGTVTECKVHPNADKLLVVQVDLGTEKRQVCAGIKQWYQPEQLVGKQVIVVANLAAKPLRGEMSQGMILATTDAATGNVVIVSPTAAVGAGSVVK